MFEGKAKLAFIVLSTVLLEEHILESNAGEQQPQTAIGV